MITPPMRVLHIVTAFPRTPEDVIAPWLVELIRRLRDRGHRIDVFSASYRGLGDQVLDGINVYRYRYFLRPWERLTHEETAVDRVHRSLLYRVLPLPFLACGAVAAWRHARRHRYDIVHVHWPVPLAILGRAVQLARPTPMVTTFYGAELRWLRNGRGPLARLTRWAIRRSARVVAISRDTARTIREATGIDPDVIPYGVASVAGTPIAERRDGFEVLFVGRLVERKGLPHLIEAMRALGDLPVRLTIVGDGPERSRLEQLVHAANLSAVVAFRGRIDAEELRRQYAAASLAVLPAIRDRHGDTEGLGVVLLEAMQHAVPVVASAIGGITDIVEDEVTGILVTPGDADGLARAIRRLATDPGFARRLGTAGREWVESRFDWDRVTDRWEEIYRGLLV